MIAPFININGTSRDELLRQAIVTADAIRVAITNLDEMTPHRRDYPSSNEFCDALFDHSERVYKLSAVLSEVNKLAAAIAG